MKKLKLNVEDLAVSSFDTQEASGTRGTVRGNEVTDLCSVSCTDPFSSWYKAKLTFSALCAN